MSIFIFAVVESDPGRSKRLMKQETEKKEEKEQKKMKEEEKEEEEKELLKQ
jgi:hypothetical protein